MNATLQRRAAETRLANARRAYALASGRARGDPEAAEEARQARREIDRATRELARLNAKGMQ
ncbi:MAG: hypothetical protein HYY78_01870 [Betaproteobacteria bacterium]|nr:hypothetical protein [Betaproteobacteria bacterium]